MTKKEVESSLPFKAVKKILKKRFPWITRIEVPEDVEKYSSLIFLKVFFNPFKFLEIEDFPEYRIDPFYLKYAFKGNDSDETWGSSALSVFFKSNIEGQTSKDRYEIFKPISREVENILSSVGRSEAFPYELRLHNNRTFDLSNFHIDPSTILNAKPSQP